MLFTYFSFQVEVALSGTGVKDEGAESGTNGNGLKVLPPWMIKQGMNLTKEQRGETSNSSNLDEKSEVKDEKKQDSKEDEKSIQVSLGMNIKSDFTLKIYFLFRDTYVILLLCRMNT